MHPSPRPIPSHHLRPIAAPTDVVKSDGEVRVAHEAALCVRELVRQRRVGEELGARTGGRARQRREGAEEEEGEMFSSVVWFVLGGWVYRPGREGRVGG